MEGKNNVLNTITNSPHGVMELFGNSSNHLLATTINDSENKQFDGLLRHI